MTKLILVLLSTSLLSFDSPKDSTIYVRRRGLDRVLFLSDPNQVNKSVSGRNVLYSYKLSKIDSVNSRRGKIKNINNGKQSQSIFQRISNIR